MPPQAGDLGVELDGERLAGTEDVPAQLCLRLGPHRQVQPPAAHAATARARGRQSLLRIPGVVLVLEAAPALEALRLPGAVQALVMDGQVEAARQGGDQGN